LGAKLGGNEVHAIPVTKFKFSGNQGNEDANRIFAVFSTVFSGI